MNPKEKDNEIIELSDEELDEIFAEDDFDNGEDGGDIPVDDPTQLAPYGINNLEEEFVKEKLNGGQMILRSKTLRLKFKRF